MTSPSRLDRDIGVKPRVDRGVLIPRPPRTLVFDLPDTGGEASGRDRGDSIPKPKSSRTCAFGMGVALRQKGNFLMPRPTWLH